METNETAGTPAKTVRTPFTEVEIRDAMAGVAKATHELSTTMARLAERAPKSALGHCNRALEALGALRGTLPLVFHKRNTLGLSPASELSRLITMAEEEMQKVSTP